MRVRYQYIAWLIQFLIEPVEWHGTDTDDVPGCSNFVRENCDCGVEFERVEIEVLVLNDDWIKKIVRLPLTYFANIIISSIDIMCTQMAREPSDIIKYPES